MIRDLLRRPFPPELRARLWLRAPWPVVARWGATTPRFLCSRAAAEVGPDGFFLQIGSNDGVAGDPLTPTLKAKGWGGVMVEALPDIHAALLANHPEARYRCLNLAIAAEPGTFPFYRVEPIEGDPTWVNQIGSFDRASVLSHVDQLTDLESRIVVEEVPSTTLRDLIATEGITRIDLLHTDVEGLDYQILRQIDFDAPWAPRFVLYEHAHLEDERPLAEELLTSAGYRIITTPVDTFAYRKR